MARLLALAPGGLEPDDIISAATPPGVALAMTPPQLLRACDVVAPGIGGLEGTAVEGDEGEAAFDLAFDAPGMIFDLQRWLYSGAIEALNALRDTGAAGLPALVGAAFAFGMLHALLPGHGKAVLTSYYAGDGRILTALGSTVLLITVHVGSAILLVLGGFNVLQRTIGGAGRAPALEHASQLLILLIGLWLLVRAFRPHRHDHDRSGPMLALVTGLIPCPLTTFVMTYAVTQGLIAAGLVLAITFAAGMIVTVAAFPLIAVALRTSLLPLVARTETWRGRIGHGLEAGSALAVVLLGAVPLLAAR